MSGNDQKRYDLKPNTNRRTRSESARLQKDPPRTSNASGYKAVQYARPEYSMAHTDPGYSRPLQYPAAPAKPTPHPDSGYLRQSSASVPPPQYARSSYSVQNDSSGKPADHLADLMGRFSFSETRNRDPDQKPTPHKSPCITHPTKDILLIIKKQPPIIWT
jgi:hypothetical protein